MSGTGPGGNYQKGCWQTPGSIHRTCIYHFFPNFRSLSSRAVSFTQLHVQLHTLEVMDSRGTAIFSAGYFQLIQSLLNSSHKVPFKLKTLQERDVTGTDMTQWLQFRNLTYYQMRIQDKLKSSHEHRGRLYKNGNVWMFFSCNRNN